MPHTNTRTYVFVGILVVNINLFRERVCSAEKSIVSLLSLTLLNLCKPMLLPTERNHVTFKGYWSAHADEPLNTRGGWNKWGDFDIALMEQNIDRVCIQVVYFLREGICDKQGAACILTSAGMSNLKVVEFLNGQVALQDLPSA